MEEIEDLRYPIGRFSYEPSEGAKLVRQIERIAVLPRNLRDAVKDLTEAQLGIPYRENGWTLRQVVHHLPDSHMNAYIRFKLAITEDNPHIRPYHEDRWAECKDAKNAPSGVSLDLLESIHKRWVLFLKGLGNEDFDRTYHHPEQGKDYTLREVLSMYAWHGEHHLAQINKAKSRM